MKIKNIQHNIYSITQFIVDNNNLLNRYLRIKPRKFTKNKQKIQKTFVKYIKYSRILGNLS